MQATTDELELRSAPGSECSGDFQGSELPRDDAALPWWERWPFSGSAHGAVESFDSASSNSASFGSAGLDSANSDSTVFASTGFGPEALPAKTFLNVLSAVAAPGPAPRDHDEQSDGQDGKGWTEEIPGAAPPAWNTPGREAAEEADSFSYEGALRRGAAVSRHPSSTGWRSEDAAWPQTGTAGAQAPAENRPAHADSPETAASNAGKRLASVTLRLSRAEYAQLKLRAAEAGVTVSAYIRSCTFEAETLRAQVKQAVKELRSELRGELHGELGGELEGESSGEQRPADGEKRPPVREWAAADALTGESPRPWWRLRTPAENHSAQA
jgi:hypothetical protein